MYMVVAEFRQVSASNQIDLKTKAAGDLIVLNIASGEEVKQGALLVQLNASDAVPLKI
jgi:multidrug efflux pump subunit AcrA (membrane-fusion protein)